MHTGETRPFLLAALLLGVGAPVAAAPGPTFRDFSGACQSGYEGPLWEHALSWDRLDLSWGACEPEEGRWNEAALEEWGKRLLAFRKRGARVLPSLGYNAPWSWDRGARTFEHGNTRWRVQPRDDGKFDVVTERRNAAGAWEAAKTEVQGGGGTWALAAAHVPAWESFVRRAVAYLRRPPYNVEYFQVWNEAYPTSGFWFGDLDTYVERVHLPAARVIRELGGKVVYGGWPCCGAVAEFVAILDKHRAWESIDVLDIHYLPLRAWAALDEAARRRGFTDMGLWQTEIGFTRNVGFIGNAYPRFLHWALTHDWSWPDRYKLFLFAYWSPDDPKAFGYHCTLYSGKRLSPHGESLRTLGGLLDGPGLKPYLEIATEPVLKPEVDERRSSIEGFSLAGRVVLLAHLAEDVAGAPALRVTLPKLSRRRVLRVERCDLSGQRLEVTGTLQSSGRSGVTFSVPTQDTEGSPAAAWNKATEGPATFAVVVHLRER